MSDSDNNKETTSTIATPTNTNTMTFELTQDHTVKRGRGRPKNSKLDKHLNEIVRRLKLGITPKALAEQCSVTRATLYNFAEKHGINMHELNAEAKKISIEHNIVVIANEMDI